MTTQTEAANRPDDGLIELTGPELLVLLSLNEGPAATRTRENLRLPDVPADSALLAAGLSSLVVRRLARVEGEVLAPVGNVVPLTRVLTTATEWVEAAAIADERTNAALLVGAQGGAVVLEPRPFGIWHVRPLQMGDPLPDAASRFVRAAFAQLPGPAVRRERQGRRRVRGPHGSRPCRGRRDVGDDERSCGRRARTVPHHARPDVRRARDRGRVTGASQRSWSDASRSS